MKLYRFANFVEQHLVPYGYASISLVCYRSLYVVIIVGNFIDAMLHIFRHYPFIKIVWFLRIINSESN